MENAYFIYVQHILWPSTKEERVLQFKPNNTYRKRVHVSGRSFDQSTQLGYLSHLGSINEEEVRKLQLCPV
jgi:hypothetical protein